MLRARLGNLSTFAGLIIVVLTLHAPFFQLPYFWDELGQFVPAALDLYHDGSLVPHSTVPNAHPPGVMAYLALVWQIVGYSIPATRVAMLLLASLAVFASYMLAQRLSSGHGASTARIAVLLLIVDPLFYMQGMMAQLDMPAMLFTVLALLLFFAEEHGAAAAICALLVLVKETGLLLPVVLGALLLLDPGRRSRALYYVAPVVVLSAWFLLLWRSTGQIFGDAGFTHYNIEYSMHPVRAVFSLLRHVYFVFVADFRWIATIAILIAWKKTSIYSIREWRILWTFIAGHVLMVSVLGGAELERYLLPVLPLFYTAAGSAFMTLRPAWRSFAAGITAAGLVAGLFVNPPFPFPFENNLAMADFVELHRAAADFLDKTQGDRTIYTAWPLTGALRNPAFGYVSQALPVVETSDLRYSTLSAIHPQDVRVLVLYSRTWEPSWSVLRWAIVKRFLARFYQYEPQMDAAAVQAHFGLVSLHRWRQRGQWIEIYGRVDPGKAVLSSKSN